ncbi:IclR family transcriptional regulator [Bacillus taeanensis]|uniref:IclR family transcriptional regulator n=1 Tax=Bacillus taeanensis TaxID=273032 RepID=A0A366XXS8_9BACI|nr:IclR family transcriptional regulator [Bacillus taeanensis]RBW70942.1 IclR family transcriptional regulator [Bacillus taeanensis]
MAVKSAVRVLEIFELLMNYSTGLSSKEIANKLSLPQSSVFNLVITLHEKGYLHKTEAKTYKLGPKLITLGASAMDSYDFYSEAVPYLRELMEKTEETIFMAVLSEEEIVYVSKVDNTRSIRTNAAIGSRNPLYSTALGKCILTFLPNNDRESLLKNMKLKKITTQTVQSKEQLIGQLDQFYKQGYSIDDGENEVGLYALAAPVFNMQNRVIAAVSVAGPRERMFTRKAEISDHLLNITKKMSERLGISE